MQKERLTEEWPQIGLTKDRTNQLFEYLGPKEGEKQLRGLYLINTRLWLDDLSKKYQKEITIGGVPDSEWDKLFDQYDNFWFMGIYKPSQKGQEIAKQYCKQYEGYLPDVDSEKDVVASPFAVLDYSPNPKVAKDWQEWDKMVDRLHQKGKKVFIDFVPNHTALDHSWVQSHPEYYIQGNKDQFSSTNNFVEMVDSDGQTRYFAYGKDPNFGPWIDTLQLNYANLGLQEKMKDLLFELAKHSDGFRCDMAMLVNPETFLRSWGWCLSDEEKNRVVENPFWQKTIPEIKKKVTLEDQKTIEFIAEAYWEEGELGKYFDFIYNHDLYKKIKTTIDTGMVGDLRSYLDYLLKNPDGTKKHWVVYTENHDENRAVEFLKENFSKSGAVVSAMIRGSIFMVNQGQEIGCRYRPPMQVSRFRQEEENQDMVRFYDDLLAIRRSRLFQTGEINIINSENGDQNSILFEISRLDTKTRSVVAVNMSQWFSSVQIANNASGIDIYNLTSGEKSTNDEINGQNIVINLQPGEVKIACLSTVDPENSRPEDECVLSDIKPRGCF